MLDGTTYAAAQTALSESLACYICGHPTRTIHLDVHKPVCTDHNPLWG